MNLKEIDDRKKEYLNRYLNGPLRTIIFTENEYKKAFHENIRDNLNLEQLNKVDNRIKIYFIRMFLNDICLTNGIKNNIISVYNKYNTMFKNRFETNILDSLSDSDKEGIKDYLDILESIKDKNITIKKEKKCSNKNLNLSKRYNELTGKDLSVTMFDKTMLALDNLYKSSEIVLDLETK